MPRPKKQTEPTKVTEPEAPAPVNIIAALEANPLEAIDTKDQGASETFDNDAIHGEPTAYTPSIHGDPNAYVFREVWKEFDYPILEPQPREGWPKPTVRPNDYSGNDKFIAQYEGCGDFFCDPFGRGETEDEALASLFSCAAYMKWDGKHRDSSATKQGLHINIPEEVVWLIMSQRLIAKGVPFNNRNSMSLGGEYHVTSDWTQPVITVSDSSKDFEREALRSKIEVYFHEVAKYKHSIENQETIITNTDRERAEKERLQTEQGIEFSNGERLAIENTRLRAEETLARLIETRNHKQKELDSLKEQLSQVGSNNTWSCPTDGPMVITVNG